MKQKAKTVQSKDKQWNRNANNYFYQNNLCLKHPSIMPKNKKNKAFIYLLLLCLLYVGGQQRVWGQDKFRTIYSWGTAIADTTPKRMLKDVGLSQVVEPQLPIIQEQRRYRSYPDSRGYTFYIDRPLSESVTLENLFTDYAFLLPPIYATDSLVLTDTIYNDNSRFSDLINEKKFNNNGVTYQYKQYHKGYRAGQMGISLIDGKVYKLSCGLLNLDVDVTNVISIDEAVGKAMIAMVPEKAKTKVHAYWHDYIYQLADTYKYKLPESSNNFCKIDTVLEILYNLEEIVIENGRFVYKFGASTDATSYYNVRVDGKDGTVISINPMWFDLKEPEDNVDNRSE